MSEDHTESNEIKLEDKNKESDGDEEEEDGVEVSADQKRAKWAATRSGSSKSSRSQGGSGSSFSQSMSGGGHMRRLSRTPSTTSPYRRPSSGVSAWSQDASGRRRSSVRSRRVSVLPQEYHVDLKPEIKSGLTVQLVSTAFIIVFGSSFQFGYNIGVLNNPSQLIKDFYNETYTNRNGGITESSIVVLWSFTNAIFIPGGMAGAFLGGYLADKIGRKRTILFSHIFAIFGGCIACACVTAKSPEMLMIGRLLFGVNCGLGNCVAPMYLSEIAPYNLRGAFGTAHQLFITIGILLSSVFGLEPLLGTPHKWPFLMLLEVIPALTSLFVLPWLPESPRYLLLCRHQRGEAEEALQFFRNREDVSADMEEMDTESQAEQKKEGDDESFTWKMLLTSKELRMPLFIACMLQVVQQFSGINAVFFYSSGIFENAGVQKDQIPYAVIGTNAVNVAMTVITVPVMDIAGRRPLLLIPMVGMIVDLVILTISLNLEAKIYWMSYISIICIIFYVICFAVGLGPIPMMIGAELFRQGPRPLAMAAAGVVNWVATFVVAMAFESIQLGMQNYTFILFLILMIGFLVFTYFKVPETKNKTFEEIAGQYAPGNAIEVEEVIEEVFDDIPEGDESDDEDEKGNGEATKNGMANATEV